MLRWVLLFPGLLLVSGSARGLGAEATPPTGEGEPDKPRLVKVLFEREVPPETLKRYALTGGILRLDAPYTEDELKQKLAKWTKSKDLVRIELYSDPKTGRYYIKSTVLGEDLDHKARVAKWRAYAMENLAINKDIGKYRHESSLAVINYRCPYWEASREDARMLHETFRGPKDEPATAVIWQVSEGTVSPHDFMRRFMKMRLAVKKMPWGYVVTAEAIKGHSEHEQYWVSWLSGQKTAVYVDALAYRPDRLAPPYGEKFPSSLPKDFRLDKTAWGREEMEMALAEMKKAVETLPPDEARERLGDCLDVRGFVYMPIIDGAKQAEAPIELLKQEYDLLAKWWAEVKDGTYWHDGMQKLVAKGQTPEELAAKEKARREAAERAVLEAPWTKEEFEAARTRLIEVFEADKRQDVTENLKTFPGCGARFAKTAEGRWEFWWQQSVNSGLNHNVFTGPTILKAKGTVRYPLKGAYQLQYKGGDGRDRITPEAEVRYYDRLTRKWVYVVPPEVKKQSFARPED